MNRNAARRAAILVCVGLLGCGEADSSLEIRASGSLDDPASLAGIELEVNGRLIRADGFTSDPGGPTEVSIPVPNDGRLVVRARLIQEGEEVANGETGWDLKPEYEWWMSVSRQAGDPAEYCFGCSGSAGFPIVEAAANQPGEALWLVWGGTPRGSDIVF